MSPLDELRDKYFINIYPPSENPKSPIATLELVDKQTREKFRHTLWRDREDPKKGYITKSEEAATYPVKKPTHDYKTTPQVSGKDALDDLLTDDIPW